MFCRNRRMFSFYYANKNFFKESFYFFKVLLCVRSLFLFEGFEFYVVLCEYIKRKNLFFFDSCAIIICQIFIPMILRRFREWAETFNSNINHNSFSCNELTPCLLCCVNNRLRSLKKVFSPLSYVYVFVDCAKKIYFMCASTLSGNINLFLVCSLNVFEI